MVSLVIVAAVDLYRGVWGSLQVLVRKPYGVGGKLEALGSCCGVHPWRACREGALVALLVAWALAASPLVAEIEGKADFTPTLLEVDRQLVDLPPVDIAYADMPPVQVGYPATFNDVAPGVFYGGAEVIFFKPFGEAGTQPQEIIAATAATDFLPAWRLWGGWSDADGLGARIRWWQYDQFSYASEFGLENFSRLIFQKLDLEVTQQFERGLWDLMASGGVTWVGNELDYGLVGATPINRWRMDAAGVTAGLQAVRASRNYEYWRWVGAVQASGVFGNSLADAVGRAGEDPVGEQPSTVGGILELSIGPRWERPIGGGASLFAGGNAEAQYWMTSLGSILDGNVPDGQGSLGLVGLSFNLGIRR